MPYSKCANYDGNVYWQQAGPGGKLVPEAVKVVISSGVTLHDYKGFSSSLRLRYFGPRYLTSTDFISQIKRCCSMGNSVINSSRNGTLRPNS